MSLTYSLERIPSEAEFIDVLARSTLAERRPVADAERIRNMVQHANLFCTAWEGDMLVGVARSLTDFAFCCYLSDLAVDVCYQGWGVGTALIRLTQSRLHPEATVVLLAAPKAREYYPRIGMTPHDSAWVVRGAPPIRGSEKNIP